MDGWDAEIGGKLPLPKGPEVRLFAGYYDYDNPLGADFPGAKGRLEVKTGSWLALDVEVFEDEELNDTNYFVGFRLQVPLSGGLGWQDVKEGLFSNRHRDLDQRMRPEMVIRDVRVHTEDSDWQEDLARRQVIRSVSEKRSTKRVVLADHITFVDGDTSGPEDGTNEQPYSTIQAGVDEAGANKTIFVYEAGGTAAGKPGPADGGGIYDEQVKLKDGQPLTSSVSWSSHGSGTYATKNRPVIRPTTVTREGTDGDSLTIENNSITAAGRRARGVWVEAYGSENLSLTIASNTISTSQSYARGIWIDGRNSDNLSSTTTNNTITTNAANADGMRFAGTPTTAITNSVTGNNLSINGALWGIEIRNDTHNSFSIPDLENNNDFDLGATALGRVRKY